MGPYRLLLLSVPFFNLLYTVYELYECGKF